MKEDIAFWASEHLKDISDENWENMIRNPWSTVTDPYVHSLFAGKGWIFYAFLMAITVSVSFVKSESLISPLAVFVVMSVLLSGMLTIASGYYFLVATGVGIGITLYMLVK